VALAPGTRLGDYEIVSPLGAGGMDSHAWSRGNLLSSGRVVERSVAEHSDSDAEQAVADPAKSSSMVVAFVV